MPNRILRDGILTSERVNALSCESEVFYRRLMSVVDDYGRFSAHTQLLRAALYPLRLDRIRDAHVKQMLSNCVAAGLVVVYSVDGKDYLELCDFRQQVRSKGSKYPAPPAGAQQMRSTCIADAQHMKSNDHLDGDGDGDGDGDVPSLRSGFARARATPQRKTRPAKTCMPADFGISERVEAWAEKHGHAKLDQHLESFRAKVAAHGYRYVDWDAAFMEAIREDWAKLRTLAPKTDDDPMAAIFRTAL